MSWAGKKSVKDLFKSLFPSREQALSFLPLSPEEEARVEARLQTWVNNKGYRLPQRTLMEAAESIGTTYSILYRYFAADGRDFRTWRTALRIEDAMEQMKAEPDTPLSTIGRRVGFSDRSNFARLFKEHIGLTPYQWRQTL
ncbi:MAG: AraC family transcriptional regulator [Bacteroidales bacterium]|nr:AraC family transcriptional regulator [Bacteroidales bacterium]